MRGDHHRRRFDSSGDRHPSDDAFGPLGALALRIGHQHFEFRSDIAFSQRCTQANARYRALESTGHTPKSARKTSLIVKQQQLGVLPAANRSSIVGGFHLLVARDEIKLHAVVDFRTDLRLAREMARWMLVGDPPGAPPTRWWLAERWRTVFQSSTCRRRRMVRRSHIILESVRHCRAVADTLSRPSPRTPESDQVSALPYCQPIPDRTVVRSVRLLACDPELPTVPPT